MASTNAERVAKSLEKHGKKQIKVVLDAETRAKLDDLVAHTGKAAVALIREWIEKEHKKALRKKIVIDKLGT